MSQICDDNANFSHIVLLLIYLTRNFQSLRLSRNAALWLIFCQTDVSPENLSMILLPDTKYLTDVEKQFSLVKDNFRIEPYREGFMLFQ